MTLLGDTTWSLGPLNIFIPADYLFRTAPIAVSYSLGNSVEIKRKKTMRNIVRSSGVSSSRKLVNKTFSGDRTGLQGVPIWNVRHQQKWTPRLFSSNLWPVL